jgi:hypothetical protein
MNEPVPLDRTARDVIEAGREGVVPNEFVAERIRRAVNHALHGSAPPARSRNRTAPILAALGAAALAGALYATELARTSEEQPPVVKPAPVAPAPRAPVASPPIATPEPSSEAKALVPATPPASARISTGDRAIAPPSARSQKLAAEIDLLARVNAAVNAGEGTKALALLAEYDREFRPGILGEERAAASVLALCAAGRTTEARAAAKRFYNRWQRSPLSARVSKSCAGAE